MKRKNAMIAGILAVAAVVSSAALLAVKFYQKPIHKEAPSGRVKYRVKPEMSRKEKIEKLTDEIIALAGKIEGTKDPDLKRGLKEAIVRKSKELAELEETSIPMTGAGGVPRTGAPREPKFPEQQRGR